jgi:hypothetical protein
MHLFTICPKEGQGSQPIQGVQLRARQDVLYIEPNRSYAWVKAALCRQGRPDEFMLPVIPTNTTREKFLNNGIGNLSIKFATLMGDDIHPLYVKETEKSEDTNALISLDLPLYHAQPHYKFSGRFKVLSAIYDDYYAGNYDVSEVEARDELCAGLVLLEEGAGVNFTYTNRYDQGKDVKRLVGRQFEYLWRHGKLIEPNGTMIHKYHLPLAPEEFMDTYSKFKLR